MGSVLVAVVSDLASFFRSRRALQLEILALRHQLAVYQRSARRPRLRPADRAAASSVPGTSPSKASGSASTVAEGNWLALESKSKGGRTIRYGRQ